jgi:hypothetical protein
MRLAKQSGVTTYRPPTADQLPPTEDIATHAAYPLIERSQTISENLMNELEEPDAEPVRTEKRENPSRANSSSHETIPRQAAPTQSNSGVGRSMPVEHGGTLNFSLDGTTEIGSQQVSQMADGYREAATIHEPMRMERILSSAEGSPMGFSGPANSISMTGGGLDERRLRRLSAQVEVTRSTFWIELITLVVAVLIGVGVGFAFLKLFVPDLFQHRGGRDSHSLSSTLE